MLPDWNFDEKIDSEGKPWPIDDGLVDKYRVFRIPANVEGAELDLLPTLDAEGTQVVLQEVDAFTFVLKPNNDHHARVAIAAYAASCTIEKPQLSKDLYDLLSQDEWGSD